MSIPRHAYLSDLAAQRISELESEGVEVTPSDVVMINAICWAQRGVGVDGVGLSRGRPVKVGNVTLWPMTIQGLHAVDEIDTEYMDDENQLYSLAYILAHGRESGAFDYGVDSDSVFAWAKTLTCTIDELSAALAEINRQSEDFETGFKSKTNDSSNPADLAAAAQRMFGETAEYWEREVSASYTIRQIIEKASETTSEKTSPKSVMLTRALCYYISTMRARGNNGEN